ncbi:MAG: NAD(P)-binding domain-containing protein [Bacteroidaceae bacterium]|nr:NAD(P)-binding domain-containing protein [Bacteroidaceae bacterium]
MKFAIIGAGNMGGALARGLARGAKVETGDITVSNPSQGKLDALKMDFPAMNITTDNCAAVACADIVVLAVKPWKVQEVVEQLKDSLDYSRQAVASMVGGLSIAQLSEWLVKEDSLPATYTIIPNTAIATMNSMTFIASQRSTEALDNELLEIFSELGKAMLLDESLIPAGTSLASCGIAYALRYISAAIAGGTELGFTAKEAQEIVTQTMEGAMRLLVVNGQEPETEINKVTTPGGLTLKGLDAMETAGFSNSVKCGLFASIKK